jgi:hypothetical protein
VRPSSIPPSLGKFSGPLFYSERMVVMTHDAGIRVFRGPHVWVDRRATCEVLVDGSVVGELGPNQDVRFSVMPGMHRVQTRLSDAASNEVEVTVEAGRTTDLKCSTRTGWALFNPLLIGRLVRLKLRAISPRD